jgi:hypothetical protein
MQLSEEAWYLICFRSSDISSVYAIGAICETRVKRLQGKSNGADHYHPIFVETEQGPKTGLWRAATHVQLMRIPVTFRKI